MRTMPAAPELPGISASGSLQRTALWMGAAGLAISLAAFLDAVSVAQSAGHLPWPVLQWAFTSPVGALALLAASLLLAAPPLLLLLLPASGLQRMLAGSLDVTGLPFEAWPQRSTAVAERTVVERWLGRGRRQRLVNLVLLVLVVLLVLALLAILLAALVYSLSMRASVRCDGPHCPPDFSLRLIALAGIIGACAFSVWARNRWWHRLEARAGIWLRYRDRRAAESLYYVRQPGVTPAAVRTALARYVPPAAGVLARLAAFVALVVTPHVLMVSAAIFLDAWLRLQWIP